ncbi:hypothetical protein NDU88_007018 [Pleurodeles waltl]|uniref:Uncharacterized protein n=1 Tax=Pleurodeles waltl TaxID=8319 RepID=A0AAV7UMQ6_PLEWA|nr:hypothetical protein NDU88_007018 [Pleurodeles waltl]
MQRRRSRPKNDSNTHAPYLSNRAKMAHGWEAGPEKDANPDLSQILTPGSGVKMGQTHNYLRKTHTINITAQEGRHGGATHAACQKTQSTGPTAAATTTPTWTPKTTQKTGEAIQDQDNPSGSQGTGFHPEVQTPLASHTAPAAPH